MLDKEGGILKQMLPAFKLGLGATLGSKAQYMSWISITDLFSLIKLVLNNKNISGVINATSPNPVTNKEFSIALANTLKRPCFFNIPILLIKIFMGEMGSMLLTGQRVISKKTTDLGFKFQHPTIQDYFKSSLRPIKRTS